MKKIVVVLFLIAIGNMSAFAQCMLRVSTTDQQAINVALDGRYFNKRGTSVTVGDLPPGNHYLQIYGVVTKKNGKLREAVIFEGKVSTNNGMITLFVFDPIHGGTIQEQDINSYAAEHKLPPEATAATNNTGNNYDNNNTQQSDDNNNDNSPVASPVTIENVGTLTGAKTDALKTQVTAKKTDTDKIKLLKEKLKSEQLSTENVAAIMDWLNFESSKLEFVKWAYSITADKENYNMLDVKFAYKDYQDEFAKFIKEQK